MENLKYKAKAAFFMSSLSTLAALVVLGCWYFGTLELAVVTLDTFVGVTVALLAIIVTVAIGWQIWAAMDLKSNIAKLDSRIREVEGLKVKMEEQEQVYRQLHNKAQHFSHIAIAETYQSKDDFTNAFRFYMSALKFGLSLNEPMNLMATIESMKICTDNIKEYIETPPRKMVNSILNNNKYIRESRLFRTIQDKYEEVFISFKEKVNIDDKQK